MKKLNYVLLLSFILLLISGCSEDNILIPEESGDLTATTLKGAKSSPNLTGTTDVLFTFTPPTFWNGTVDFKDEGIYGLTFISHGPPRDFSQASPFMEDFIIYELGTDWTIPENVYIRGWNDGVVVYANKDPEPVKFLANGKIEEAYGPLEMWQGRTVHIRGLVSWMPEGYPEAARGTLRIN